MRAHIRSWARLPALACTVVMSLLAGSACTTPPDASPNASPDAAPTTLAATPSPTVDPRTELASQVTTAGLQPKDLGGGKVTAEETIGKLAMPCNTPLNAEYVAAHSWTFSDAKPAVVSQSVYAYFPETGKTVVDQIRPGLATCKKWTWVDTWEMAVVGEFTVAVPSGADNAVAYCHHGTILTGTTKGNQVYLCDAAISRGHLVTQVGTVQLTLAEAQSNLKKALVPAGAALVRSVATP